MAMALSASSIQIPVSYAFDQNASSHIILHGYTDKACQSEWFTFQMNQESLLYFRILKSENELQTFLKGAQLYENYLANISKYDKELRIVVPLIKYAISKENNHAEILSHFCGVPLRDLWPSLQKSQKKEIDNATKIINMSTIFTKCMEKLMNLVCGTLSPETILFDQFNMKVRVQDAYALKHIDQVTDLNPFYIDKPGIYYSQTFQNLIPRPLNKSEAMTADIIALAICIWELGLPDSMPITMFISDKNIVISKLIKCDKIFEDTKNQPHSVRLKEALLAILQTKKDLLYNMENLKIDSPVLKENTDFNTIVDNGANELTINGKSFFMPGINLKKYGSKNVYLVSYETTSLDIFILKKYQPWESKEFQREKRILKKIDDVNEVSPIKAFAKLKKNIETGERELAIEYGGVSLLNQFRISAKTSEFQSKLFSSIIDICTDLMKLRMYHGDIKPFNLSSSEKNEIKLFDYDISNIDIEPINPTKDNFEEDIYKFQIRGCSVDYAAPEIIKSLLENKQIVECNPFKADIYSIAKTILAIITANTTYPDILKNFYGVESKDIDVLVKDNQFYKAICSEAINGSKPRAIYYVEHNEDFVHKVKDLKLGYIQCNETLFKSIVNMLSTMLSTNPKERPNLEQIKTMYQQISNLGKWETFKYSEQFIMQIQKGDFEIVSFENKDIYKKESLNDIKEFQYLLAVQEDQMPGNESEGVYTTEKPQIVKITRTKTKDEEGNTISLYKFNPPTLLDPMCHGKINEFATQVHCFREDKLEPILYSIGGQIENDPTKSVYALENSTLVQKADMAFARSEFGIVSWNNFIAVAGGNADTDYMQDEAECSSYLNNVEIYDAKYDKWSQPILLKEHKKSMAMAYKNKKIYIIGGILSRVEPIIDEVKEDFDISVIYGKRIEIINVENIGAEVIVFEITSNLFNGICLCPAIVRDEQTIIVLKDLLVDPVLSDSQYIQSIYNIRLDQNSKKAVIVSEKADDDLAPYYGYEATNCFEIPSGHLIIPKFNESSQPTVAKIIEYDSKENKFEVYSFNANN